ncbi:MAG: flagellar hook protein FlgE [Campylobacterales bacterium]|nr:flagellar hook protein FlgE [Campylobacterales bacterium]
MNQAFLTGLNGVQMHEFGIDNISNNLANINTIGYRATTVEFATLFEKVMSQGESKSPMENSVGIGARVQANAMDRSQGVLMLTDSSTDLAIDGDGWFGVQHKSGEVLYTRGGNFTFDAERSLVAYDGMYVLGTIGNNIQNGVLTQTLSEVPLAAPDAQQTLNFPRDLIYPVEPTTTVSFSGNLGISDDPLGMNAIVISDEDAYERKDLRLLFEKSSVQPNEGVHWDIKAELMDKDGVTVFDTQTGLARFDSSGGLIGFELPALDNNGTPLLVDLGSGFEGITSVDSRPNSSSSQANGLEHGDLLGYNVGLDGNIEASFSNGRSSAVGRIAVYHFNNDQGLESVSSTHFRENANSGDAYFYQDASGQYALGAYLQTHRLENSNVRYDVGMTDLIIMQRAYMANAKSITTGDELIQKALQM